MRIFTLRATPESADFEAIDYDPSLRMFRWLAEDAGLGAAFPVTEEFVKEKFAANGRTYDRFKLPTEPRYWDGTWDRRLGVAQSFEPKNWAEQLVGIFT